MPRASPWRRTSSNQLRSVPAGRRGRGGGSAGLARAGHRGGRGAGSKRQSPGPPPAPRVPARPLALPPAPRDFVPLPPALALTAHLATRAAPRRVCARAWAPCRPPPTRPAGTRARAPHPWATTDRGFSGLPTRTTLQVLDKVGKLTALHRAPAPAATQNFIFLLAFTAWCPGQEDDITI